MLHRHRHGGPRNASPVSTPTAQPSNCPNSHRGQHLCTHSRFPYPLPQPISIPTTGVNYPDLGRAPMEECSHSTPGSLPMSRSSPTNSDEHLQHLEQVMTILSL